METIGTTQNKLNKILFTISRWSIYSWLLMSLVVFFLVFDKYNLINILTSLIVCSIIFIPIYLVIFSTIQNKNIGKRILLAFLAIIPNMISYYILTNKIEAISIFSICTLLIFILYLLLNYSILINKRSYIFLIIYSMINSLLFIAIYILYHKNFMNIDNYFVNSSLVLYALFLLMGVLSMNIAFLYHSTNLLLERVKENA